MGKVILALFLCLTVLSQPAQAANGPCEYQQGPCQYEDGYEWIVGIDIMSYTCFSLESKERRPILQFQVNNKWINKVKSTVTENASFCDDPEYPYFTKFNFKMDTKGQISFGSDFKKRIKSRIYIPKTKSYKAYFGPVYINNVYPSIKDYENQVTSDVIAQMNQDLADALSDTNSGSSGSTGGYSSSKLSGCLLKNKQLFGKVQIVEYGADFKIQKVDYGSDLKVQLVEYGASSCGRWQIVDYGANFKIQIVDYGADFKVQFVDYGEGLR